MCLKPDALSVEWNCKDRAMFYCASPGPDTWHIEGMCSLGSNSNKEEEKDCGFIFFCLSKYLQLDLDIGLLE